MTVRFVAHLLAALIGAVALLAGPANAERLRDLATLQGVRPNQLVGYGLVVGLDGTGDQTTQTPFTVASLANMLSQLGVQLPVGTTLQLKNVAAVMVTAQLPAFAKPGQALDITVSSLGNAKSIRGGTLLLTPLKGADAQVYAMAQGNVIVGGAGAASGGSKVQVNHLSAGRIPAGATVERAVASPFAAGEYLYFEMRDTDFSGTTKVAEVIERELGPGNAVALDGRVVRVKAPSPMERVSFIARLENLDVARGVVPARVIVNARNGSVVMTRSVTLDNCAIAHGNLSITISSNTNVSQPNALASGRTVVTDDADIGMKAGSGALTYIDSGAKLADVVKALNALGASAPDLVSILEAMRASGALRAELEVI
jgi:flagellar P-ring protein precursor FlgI